MSIRDTQFSRSRLSDASLFSFVYNRNISIFGIDEVSLYFSEVLSRTFLSLVTDSGFINFRVAQVDNQDFSEESNKRYFGKNIGESKFESFKNSLRMKNCYIKISDNFEDVDSYYGFCSSETFNKLCDIGGTFQYVFKNNQQIYVPTFVIENNGPCIKIFVMKSDEVRKMKKIQDDINLLDNGSKSFIHKMQALLSATVISRPMLRNSLEKHDSPVFSYNLSDMLNVEREKIAV